MNLHLTPSPIWWAEQAGEDRAQVKFWMERARTAKHRKHPTRYCVGHARYYHRQYLLHIKEALSYLRKREEAIKVSVTREVVGT